MTRLAGRSLSRLLKRWTPLIAKSVLTLTGHLRDQKTPEHVVLGSCTILSTQTVLRHLTTVTHYFFNFILNTLFGNIPLLFTRTQLPSPHL